MRQELGFEHTIEYLGFEIEVEVGFRFYKGTTPAMGPNPDMVELIYVLDGNGKNILQKLDRKKQYNTIFELEERAMHEASFTRFRE